MTRILKLVIFAYIVLAAGNAVSEEVVRVNPVKVPAREARFDFGSKRQDELMQVMEILRSQINTLKKNQKKYKSGVNPEYGEIQNTIDELEAEHAAAYKVWFERRTLADRK